jgi:hypothetical protein
VAVASPPDVQLPGNPSSLAVFASVRLSVLERWRRHTSHILLSNLHGDDDAADSDDELSDKEQDGAALKVPKVCLHDGSMQDLYDRLEVLFCL